MAISSPLYVRQDEVINLTCKAIAFPRPSVQWSINGTVRAGRGPGVGFQDKGCIWVLSSVLSRIPTDP